MLEKPFAQITSQDIDQLKKLIGSQNVLTGSAISEDYAHDELGGIQSMPEALVRPQSAQDVAAVMRYANQRRIPVVARGSGTGLVGGATPVCGGILLETLSMNRILELDEDNLCITVEPGVLLMELAAYCQKHGFLYPPDPGEKTATIGGNISTNAGGMRAVKYGVTRDYVVGLEVVLPSGEVLALGGKTVKNSTGYRLQDLVVGSEGTLAIITKATLKLISLPVASTSLLVPFHSMEEALNAVSPLLRSPIGFTAIEFVQQEILRYVEEYLGRRFPDTKSPAYLLLTVDGEGEDLVHARCNRAAAACMELGAIDAYFVDTQERKEDVWNARGAFLEAIKAGATEMDECDVVVPPAAVGEFIGFTRDLAKRLGIRIPCFGHAGDGNLHVYLCRDGLERNAFLERMNIAFDAMYDEAFRLGGMVSGEHGIGYGKRKYMAANLGDEQVRLMREIKQVFDPNGILNPHKVV